VHIEDSVPVSKSIENLASSRGKSYLNARNLDELEVHLSRDVSAVTWIVDGRFPRSIGLPEDLASEAINLIRTRYPAASIAIYTVREDAKEFAAQLSVEGFCKLETASFIKYLFSK
jgi:hypothetical protein